jgi:hypothetical protein
MSLIRNGQSDVKKHLSSLGKMHLHLVQKATEADAAGFSGDGVTTTEPNASYPALKAGESATGIDAAVAPSPSVKSSISPKMQS